MPQDFARATKDFAFGAEQSLQVMRSGAPIFAVGRNKAGAFVASLDDETRAARFRHFITPRQTLQHYASLDETTTRLFGWIDNGAIRGLAEGMIYVSNGQRLAELALVILLQDRHRDMARRLLARVVTEMFRREAQEAYLVLGSQDCFEARIAGGLGGQIDWHDETATFTPELLMRPAFAAVF